MVRLVHLHHLMHNHESAMCLGSRMVVPVKYNTAPFRMIPAIVQALHAQIANRTYWRGDTGDTGDTGDKSYS